MTRIRTLLHFLTWPVQMPMWFAICVLLTWLADCIEPARYLLAALAARFAP